MGSDGGKELTDSGILGPDAASSGESGVLLPTGDILEIPEAPDRNGPYDCQVESIRCVPLEYQTIQAAADAVAAGDSVVVEAGNYEGFTLRTTGTKEAPIRRGWQYHRG